MMERMPEDEQNRMLDAGQALMDMARAATAKMYGDRITDSGMATSVAMQLAIQTVFQSELYSDRKKGEGEFVAYRSDVMRARFHGLGAGCGQVIGAMAPGGMHQQLAALTALEDGMESAISIRTDMAVKRFRDQKGKK